MTGAPVHFADRQAEAAVDLAGRNILICDDLLPEASGVSLYLAKSTGLPVLSAPASKLLARADGKLFGVFALHNVTGTAEAELLAVAGKGVIQRSVLRYLAMWIFEDCRVRRLVCRIPASNRRLQDYARRCGFRFESRAARYFSDDLDASVWVMSARDCTWLAGGGDV